MPNNKSTFVTSTADENVNAVMKTANRVVFRLQAEQFDILQKCRFSEESSNDRTKCILHPPPLAATHPLRRLR